MVNDNTSDHGALLFARIISQVGFPIVTAVVLLYYVLYRFDATIQHLGEQLQSVSNAMVTLSQEQRTTNDLLRARIAQEENFMRGRQ